MHLNPLEIQEGNLYLYIFVVVWKGILCVREIKQSHSNERRIQASWFLVEFACHYSREQSLGENQKIRLLDRNQRRGRMRANLMEPNEKSKYDLIKGLKKRQKLEWEMNLCNQFLIFSEPLIQMFSDIRVVSSLPNTLFFTFQHFSSIALVWLLPFVVFAEVPSFAIATLPMIIQQFNIILPYTVVEITKMSARHVFMFPSL